MQDPRSIVPYLLKRAYYELRRINHDVGGVEIGEGSVGEGEIRADQIMADRMVRLAKAKGFQGMIFTEDAPEGQLIGRPTGWYLTVDELDGSNNYRRGGVQEGCATTIALFFKDRAGSRLTFQDCVAAGTISLSNGLAWFTLNGRSISTNLTKHRGTQKLIRISTSDHKLIERPAVIVVDNFFAANRRLIAEAFKDTDGYIGRDTGSAALDLARVADGRADAYISVCQKAHELGPAYCLIKKAGGVVVDFAGRDIGTRPFSFTDQYAIVAAATPDLAGIITKLLSGRKLS